MSEKHHRPWRLLNRDGTFNIAREKRRAINKHDAYHSLMSLSLGRLLVLMGTFYIAVNTVFALLYVAAGPDALMGISHESFSRHFSDSFFFSVQTFSTIGYGKITPESVFANILVTLEALIGLLSVALTTGLIFSRFSKPTARVLFSETAIISLHDGVPSLLFRMANQRLNQIVEASVNVVLSINEKTAEGEVYRTFHDLKVERSRTPIFTFTWTIVHPIEKDSPLYGMTKKNLEEAEAEILVTLNGIDDIFSQNIHSRFSYTPDEIHWNKKFADMLSRQDGLLAIDMSQMHVLEESNKMLDL